MLDIRVIRETPETVKNNLKKRGEEEKIKWVDQLLEHDQKWRAGLKRVEKLRHERNVITEAIARLKREKKSVTKEINQVKNIPEKIKKK